MIHRVQTLARFGSAMILFACATDTAPTAPDSDVPVHVPPSFSTGTPTPEELATMPSEFSTGPSLLNTGITVGFVDGDGAYAEAYMTYLGTNAEQDATLTVKLGTTEVGKRTGRSTRHDFFPAERDLFTMISLPFTASCGHLAIGAGAHKTWHSFVVGGWKFMTWGEQSGPSSGSASQPPCAPPTRGSGGGGDDSYDGGCELCQQWFYFYGNGEFSEWWECTPLESCSETF